MIYNLLKILKDIKIEKIFLLVLINNKAIWYVYVNI